MQGRKGEFVEVFTDLLGQGYARAIVDGETIQLTEPPTLKKQNKHVAYYIAPDSIACAMPARSMMPCSNDLKKKMNAVNLLRKYISQF